MAEELSYVIITPYTIVKSRTGAIIARLLSRLDLELIAVQVLAPDEKLVEDYAESMLKYTTEKVPKTATLLHDYVYQNFMPSEGRPHRVLILVFKGEDAIKKLSDIVGAILPENRSIESVQGETIRDTYGDFIYDKQSPEMPSYFEPAVLSPRSIVAANANLQLFAAFASRQDNLVCNMNYLEPKKISQTLVILKPDNWRYASSRPGSIIDMFSRAGLRIIGSKLYEMPVEDALEFYGPVKGILKEKLSPMYGKQAAELLERKFKVSLTDSVRKDLTESFGQHCALNQFNQIIEFMTGVNPDECLSQDLSQPGKVKCLVLIYEGIDAVDRIRKVLGPTDPSKAPGGTVRREFGHDVMVNTAHASDSIENAQREMGIVKIHKNRLSEKITHFLNKD